SGILDRLPKPFHVMLPRRLPLDSRSRQATLFGKSLGVIHQVPDYACERGDIVLSEQPAPLALADRVGDPAGARADYRYATCLRFQEHHAEPLDIPLSELFAGAQRE